MSTNVKAPPPRDIQKEADVTLAAQKETAPIQYENYARFTPQYDAIDQQRLATGLFGVDSTAAGRYFRDNPDVAQTYQATDHSMTADQFARQHYLEHGKDEGRTFTDSQPMSLMDINNRLTDNAALQSQKANTAQRQSDLNDVQKMSPQVQQTIRGANGELFGGLDRLDQFAGQDFGNSAVEGSLRGQFLNGDNAPQIGSTQVHSGFNPAAYQTNARIMGNGQSAIQGGLEYMAGQGLMNGGQLTPDQLRSVQQSSRAGFAARGLDATNASVVDETHQTQAAQAARLLAAQNFASGVDQQGFGQRQALNQQNLALMGANQGDNGQRIQAQIANQGADLSAQSTNAATYLQNKGMQNQLGMGLLGQQNAEYGQKLGALTADVGARQSTFFDPYQGVLGRSSVNQGTNAALFGQGNQGTAANSAAGRAQFDPFSQYASSLNGQNFGEANSNARANAAASNAITGGLISSAGSAAGAM